MLRSEIMLKRIYRVTINLTAAEKAVLEDMAEANGFNRCEMVYWLIRQEAYRHGYWKLPANVGGLDDWPETRR